MEQKAEECLSTGTYSHRCGFVNGGNEEQQGRGALGPFGMHTRQSEPADEREDDEKEPRARATGLGSSGRRMCVLIAVAHVYCVLE